MSKHYLFIISLLISLNIHSQSYPYLNHFQNKIPITEELRNKAIAKNNISSMIRTSYAYKKSGARKKKISTGKFTYDKSGFTTSVENITRNKTEKYNYRYGDTLLSSYEYYRNGKLLRSYEILRNKKSFVTDKILKNKKGEIESRQHYDYDQFDNLEKTSVFNKKGREIKAIEYAFLDKKTLKEAKEYRKGKLKKVWNYTCDPAGNSEEKVKRTQVCKNVSVDENGNRVETNRIVNSKGEVELRVNTFDKDYKLIAQKVYDDIKHRLKHEFKIWVVNGNEEVVSTGYSKRGKKTYHNITIYSPTRSVLAIDMKWKNKLVLSSKFLYNEKDLLTQVAIFDSKDRLTQENTFTFD
jgi:hypothetical protein